MMRFGVTTRLSTTDLAALRFAIATAAIRRADIDGLHAAAIAAVVSLALYLPIYFVFFEDDLLTKPTADLVFQALYQGVLTAAISLALYGRRDCGNRMSDPVRLGEPNNSRRRRRRRRALSAVLRFRITARGSYCTIRTVALGINRRQDLIQTSIARFLSAALWSVLEPSCGAKHG
jgi:hypothetical protein